MVKRRNLEFSFLFLLLRANWTCFADPEKKRYFKIEKASTAPSWAAWNAEVVRKRKADDLAREEAKYREHILRNHVKRSPLWEGDPVSTALLRSETGDLGRRGNQRELASVTWAQGLNRRGGVEFADDHDHGRAAKAKGFWVGGEEDGLLESVMYARRFPGFLPPPPPFFSHL